jgi:tRNA A-37 threonylcarbamoyl transferase component Bud32
MKGAAYLASGADTCVYSPQVKCVPGTQVPESIPAGDYVSRVTDKNGYAKNELANQLRVKDAIRNIQEKHGVDVSSSFNLSVATCTPEFTEEDLVGGPCRADTNKITTPGVKEDKINFITPRQGQDFYAHHPPDVTAEQLRTLYHAVVYLNEQGIVHGDIHDANVSWMGDHLVLHDWGRMFDGVEGVKTAIATQHIELDYLQQLFDESIIVLDEGADDATLLRFIQFYDIVCMAYNLEVDNTNTDAFIGWLNELWEAKLSGDKLTNKLHVAVNGLFRPKRGGKRSQTDRFCKCIKSVRKTVKARKGSTAEGAAIAICTKSVLQRKRRTLRKVRCRDHVLLTQPMKGGVLLGAGTGAMVFGLKSNENFLPPPVGSIPPIPPGLGPGDIVAHVTKTVDRVNGKNTLVQRLGAENPYVKMVTTPSIGTYDVKTDTFLSTFVKTQENLISGSADAMKLYERWSSGTQTPLTCSLMLRHNKFSEGDILSLVDLMIGLVHINGRFVHADLNDDNMGIMRDGCPVITDYDRLQTDPIRLGMYIERSIVENTSDFPWFADIEELYLNMSPASEAEALQFMGQLMKIFDLLTVLYFVDETNPKLSAITKAFRDWIRQNWKTMDQQTLHKTVSKLGQLIIKATTGKEWRPMTMEAEITMAKEYNARPQPARNTPGLWDATRNQYRFGI